MYSTRNQNNLQGKRGISSHAKKLSDTLPESRRQKKQEQERNVHVSHAAPLPDQLINVDEVCQFLQIGKTKLYELIRDCGLPVYKIKGVNRFDPHEIWQWLQLRRNGNCCSDGTGAARK